MKQVILLSIAVLTGIVVQGQDVTGRWFGALNVQGIRLRLVFDISKSDTGYSSTMDSPDQGAKGIPVTSTTFENSIVKLDIDALKINYTGELKSDSIVGTFKQGGLAVPMNLSRKSVEKQVFNRPQEPTKPYPYYSEDVVFENKKDKISLAGTLTLPKKEGNFPAVVLITGSGPQNRDEELLGHKPFLVLSDYLTKNGIAVLRYDDRGTGGSKGDFKTATSADFADDVEAALSYLQSRKEINSTKIGLIGHSEGGLIAPMVAGRSKAVSYIVLLAGTGLPGDQILLMQQELIGRASGMSETDLQKAKEVNRQAYTLIKESTNADSLKKELTTFLKNTPQNRPAGMKEDDFIRAQVSQLTTLWMKHFLTYDPAPALEKVQCPVLALNGEKDLQVPAAVDLTAIRKALEKGGNKHVTTKELPSLNHLFQECKTGAPSEYAVIEQTFSPTALTEITSWIQQQAK